MQALQLVKTTRQKLPLTENFVVHFLYHNDSQSNQGRHKQQPSPGDIDTHSSMDFCKKEKY